MATTTTRRRRRTTTRRRATTRNKGFNGKQILKDAELPLQVGVGIFAGKLIHDAIRKGSEVAGLGATEDGKKATTLLQPAILAAAGLIAPQFIENKHAKGVGAGVALYAVITGAKNYTGKDLLGSLAPERKFDFQMLGVGNPSVRSLPMPAPAHLNNPNHLVQSERLRTITL